MNVASDMASRLLGYLVIIFLFQMPLQSIWLYYYSLAGLSGRRVFICTVYIVLSDSRLVKICVYVPHLHSVKISLNLVPYFIVSTL